MNRFDLEQQILDAWKVTDDIHLLFENVIEKELTTDQISNVLMGLQHLYEMKFNKLWDTFEGCIKNKEL